MGYTHYWYRPKRLKKPQYSAFVRDCMNIVRYCEKDLGINLAGWDGDPTTKPELSHNMVRFNGSDGQEPGPWTTDQRISIPWPSPSAGITDPTADPIAMKTDGVWYAGDLVSQRVAPLGDNGKGEGAYETFSVPALITPEKWQEAQPDGSWFWFCKTAYRPYDLTVTACLIALRHHFPDVRVSTDGESKDWMDAKVLCYNLLGYGMEYDIDADGQLSSTTSKTEQMEGEQ